MNFKIPLSYILIPLFIKDVSLYKIIFIRDVCRQWKAVWKYILLIQVA